MPKGCTGLQNIQLLRWCEELGITVFWNLLYGFPSESSAEYARMAELIPLLAHLQKPGYCGRIHVDRFSPLFTNAKLGVTDPRPAAAYFYLYPLASEQLGNLAYFFEFDYTDHREPARYAGAVAEEVVRWPEWTDENRPRLDLFQTDSIVLFTDTRAWALKPSFVLTGLDAKIYLSCDTTQTPRSIGRMLCVTLPEIEVHARLESFRDARLMAEADGRYLSLAVWRNRPPQERVAASAHVMEVLAESRSLLNVFESSAAVTCYM